MTPHKEAPLERFEWIRHPDGVVEVIDDPKGGWVRADEVKVRIDERDAEIARLKAERITLLDRNQDLRFDRANQPESIPRSRVEKMVVALDTSAALASPELKPIVRAIADGVRSLLDEEPEGDDG